MTNKERTQKSKLAKGLKNSKESKDLIDGNVYHRFSKTCSDAIGHAGTFIVALLTVVVWFALGTVFEFSNTWQLVINTATSITTFLIVFLIQNTLNRENEIIQIKLDELIKAHKKARNTIIDLETLSDADLKQLEKRYCEFSKKE